MTQAPERLSAKSWFMIGALILFFPLLAAIVSVMKDRAPHAVSLIEKYSVEAVRFDVTKFSVADSLADAQYPADRWDPMLFQILEEGPKYLPADTNFGVVPPPANTSPETAAELQILRSYARHLRTPENEAVILAEHQMTRMYEPFEKAGLFVPAGNKPTVDLIDMAQQELSYFIIKAKRDFNRVRPDTLAPDLKTMFENPRHAAYPSGHGSQGYMTAAVLSLLDPAHEKAYKALGFDIGLRREIAGVHYPSDAVAGRQISQGVLDRLVEIPAFREQLEKAKASFVPAPEESIASYKPVDTKAVHQPAKAE